MREVFDEIREQIHGIRNMVAPFDLKLASLDHDIAAVRNLFEQRTAMLETKINTTGIRLDQHDSKIAEIEEGYAGLSERMKRLEIALISPPPEQPKSLPVREDKIQPEILPPQSSAT